MLLPGTRLGPYDVIGAIGAGGMGEVYRARDARLNRDVAVKLLPDAFGADRDRLARFEREAQTLASLNHPNIAQIYGVIERPAPDRGPALVMELVEGEDLAQRISRGRIALEEAIPIARQIADALEAAHEQGIVHRDLKPANVKVRPDGCVKVLDFGLAKGIDPAASSSSPAMANSPTFTAHATQLGMIVGTAAYMAPEQARGKVVDRRADVWAFGAVLYEMLTGRRAFEGDELSDVLAAVLKSEPQWGAMPPGTPASIRRLLRRCLEKDPRKRLSAIADARFELDEQDALAPAVPTPAGRRRVWRDVLAALGGAALTAMVAVGWQAAGTREVPRVQRSSLLPPAGSSLYPDSSGIAISPDGTMIAFVVGSLVRSDTHLWVRSRDSMEATQLEDTAGAILPFWSPDSRQIGFFTSTKLKAIAASGGRAQVLADLKGGGRGATWGRGNIIVYAPDSSGPLYRVDATGGTPAAVTSIDETRHQYGHRFPVFLPDGRHFLYAALPARNGAFDVFAGSLAGGAPVLVGAMETAPVYADPGYVLYARQGVLRAQPFDTRALKLIGEPITLTDAPSMILDPRSSYTAGHVVSVSASGELAYYSSPALNTVVDAYDLTGRRTGSLPLPPGYYDYVKISPDGTQAAVVRSASASESTVWVLDLARGGAVPLSTGPGRNDAPIWSPDASRIVFGSDRDGAEDLFVKSLGDAAPEQPLFRSPVLFKNPSAWSPDGTSIVITETDPASAQNIWLLSLAEPHRLTPLVTAPTRDVGVAISPDGRWLAYASDETGRYQLYVRALSGPLRTVQVSQDGALSASWSRDQRQLYVVGDDNRSISRVDVVPGAAFSPGPATKIAQLPPDIVALDVDPSRQRIIALAPERSGTGSVTIVANWRAALGTRQ